MATISEYMSGKICEQISLALSIMDDAPKGQLNGTKIGEALIRNVEKLEPRAFRSISGMSRSKPAARS